jgi:hypothetical protein
MSSTLDPDVQAVLSAGFAAVDAGTKAVAAAYNLQAKLNALQTLPFGPSNAFLNLEKRNDWIQPGNVGNTGGGSTAPHGTFNMIPGSPATFTCQGAIPYDNGYWYTVIDNTGLLSNAKRFRYDLEVQAGWDDLAAMQALEFELQLTIAGLVFNMAWQADSVTKLWRTFNYSIKQWEPTQIAFDSALMAGKFCSISSEFVINPDKSVTHSLLSIDGLSHALAITHVSAQSDPATANYLHAAFQLDSNGATPPTAYSVQVREMNVWAS